MRNFGTLVMLLLAGNSAEANVCFKAPEKMASYIFTESPDFYTYKKEIPDFVSSSLGKLLGRDWKCQEPGDLCALDVYPWTQAQDGDVPEPVSFYAKNINDLTQLLKCHTRSVGWTQQLVVNLDEMSFRLFKRAHLTVGASMT